VIFHMRFSKTVFPLIFSVLFLMVQPVNADSEEAVPASYLIYAGQLMVEAGKPTQSAMSILISDGKIQAVESGYLDPSSLKQYSNVKVLDHRNRFVMPGLIDVHVHLEMANGNKKSPYELTEADLALNGAHSARLTVEAGFTTVRDLGASTSAIFALRESVKRGLVPGPRILAAGAAVAIVGGHGDDTGYHQKVWSAAQDGGVCSGTTDCVRAVRHQVKRGADVIKLTASGGGGKPQGGPSAPPEFFDDEIAGIVNTAHRLDRKVAAHAHGNAGVLQAVEAGVDSIEHGTFVAPKTLSLMKKMGTFLVPTLSVRDNLIRDLDNMTPGIQKRAKLILDVTPEVMGGAYRRGVKIALGSDAGVVPHGDNVRELEWLVKVGMSNQDALKAGTIDAAELLGLVATTGSIAVGKSADIIAVDGDPLSEIEAMRKVDFVMARGKVFKGE